MYSSVFCLLPYIFFMNASNEHPFQDNEFYSIVKEVTVTIITMSLLAVVPISPGSRNLGSTTLSITSDLRYNEVRYNEARLYKRNSKTDVLDNIVCHLLSRPAWCPVTY